ncbi:MAG TPA: folylpolyglutamate synthase/dihydrofolate synthase family protein [Chthoniobacteraceae bacterium]
MNFDQAMAWLYATQLHGIKLGLGTARQLTTALQLRVNGPNTPRFLHIAGTNGKGSVCAMLDAICRAEGLKSGLFTSPHLVTFRERIRVNGRMISETAVARGLTRIRDAAEGWEPGPTFFEIATALALLHFQEEGCEIVVLETGLGGRLDATNVVTPAVCVITPIALDHQQWLGDTLAEIATEKAGIFKESVPVISAPQPEEAAQRLEQHAREVGALLTTFVTEPWTESPIKLAGSHQQWNAALAVHALPLAGVRVSQRAIERGLAEVHWPGRFQRVRERIILDGAHNPAAAARLVITWREVFRKESATLVIGVLADKDARGILAELLPISARVITVPVQNPRSLAPEELRSIAQSLSAAESAAAGDLAAAIQLAEQAPEPILICGSLFLIGEALAHFDSNGSPVERSAQ